MGRHCPACPAVEAGYPLPTAGDPAVAPGANPGHPNLFKHRAHCASNSMKTAILIVCILFSVVGATAFAARILSFFHLTAAHHAIDFMIAKARGLDTSKYMDEAGLRYDKLFDVCLILAGVLAAVLAGTLYVDEVFF